ncbi:MAG: aldehyde dehydrogenase family protein, partial [Rhodobacteraceae bacterium]|nr:aldehyde dehydrogenase family protein [Paracoccaceae bacterium]
MIADLHISDQQNLIGGNWKPARDGHTIPVFCPSDGKPFCLLAASSAADIDAAVTTARLEFAEGSWSKLTATARGRLLTNLANEISRNHDRLAEIEAKDTGKPISQAHADIDAATRYCEFYGGAADKLHGEVIPYLDGYQVQAIREPFGVTGHIIPWNYPAQMFGRSVVGSLAGGNCIVLKPAEDASLTPLLLAQLAMDVGFPDGALNVVTGTGETAGAALAAHPGIDFISFTGSPETGVHVQAAAAQNHIGCTLELGGKSPQILFEDADIEAAVPAIIRGIIQNGGQTCSAGSRALIQTS